MFCCATFWRQTGNDAFVWCYTRPDGGNWLVTPPPPHLFQTKKKKRRKFCRKKNVEKKKKMKKKENKNKKKRRRERENNFSGSLGLATPVSNTLHAMGWERVGGLYRYGVGVSRRNRRSLFTYRKIAVDCLLYIFRFLFLFFFTSCISLNSATTVHRLLSPIPPTEFCLFKI